MKPKHFVLLALAAGISSIAAIVTYAAHNQWNQGRVTGAKLFPTLTSEAGNVAAIEVRQGEKSLTLERSKDSGWAVKDRGGYPADNEKIRALMLKLVQAELIEAKTRAPDRHSLIEVEDPTDKAAKSRLLRLVDAKGAAVAETVVGKKRFDVFGSGRSGTYVRRPKEMQSWLASAEIDPSLNVRDWVKLGVFEADAGKIKSLAIEMPGEQPLKIERDAEGKLKFAGLPENRKLKDAGAADAIVRAAGSLDMEDMRKATAGSDIAGTVKLDADGLAVTLRIRKDAAGPWLSIAATGEGDAKKRAEELGARTQGWEFKIAASKADALLKRRADLLEAGS
jgi:hypothetical protein